MLSNLKESRFSTYLTGRSPVKLTFILIAIFLGLLQAAVGRHYVNPDGVSYLDMSDPYWRGDWKMALNSYWSPLYSILIGILLNLLSIPTYWEAAAVHLVNFFI